MAIMKINGTVVRVTTYNGGAPRKHGNWRPEFKDAETALLDGIASRKVAPMGRYGLVIRKKIS